MEQSREESVPGSVASLEEGSDIDDSDFDSSDLDPVLMSVGQGQEFESARVAKRWGQRQAQKRRKRRGAKRTVAEAANAALERPEDRSSCDDSDDQVSHKRQRGSASSARSSRSSRVTSSALDGGRLPAMMSDEVRNILVKGQAQYTAGLLDEALATMHQVVKLQPGLAEPYQVLAVIHEELGNDKKKLDCMLLSAYFTPGEAGQRTWRQVGILSKQQGLLDQARYAYRRSISRKRGTPEDLEGMWELAQLYLERGRIDEGIRELYALYEATEDEAIACQVAKHLITRKRWRDCLELLEACVERGRQAKPVRVDLNTLNVYSDILLEVREFTKCANLLTDILQLRGSGEEKRGNIACQTSLSDQELLFKFREVPADLVAQLAIALCRLRERDAPEADPLCAAAIKAVLLQPPATHCDLYLLVVDALLVEDNVVAGQAVPRDQRRSSTCKWPAEEALRILELLRDAEISEDLRDRRAKALWQLGHARAAAELLDQLLDEPGGRSEGELRELAARSAQAWFECGHPERADTYLGLLNYEDVLHSTMLPQALSTEQRRSEYEELSLFMDRASSGVGAAQASSSSSAQIVNKEELRDFADRFRHLVYDCELDYARLTHWSHTCATGTELSTQADSSTELSTPTGPAHDKGAELVEQPRKTSEQASVSSTTPSSCSALVPSQHPNSEDVDDQESEAMVLHALAKPRGSEVQVLAKNSSILMHKRRHIGLESVEHLFGFEAYIEFVLRGINLLVAHLPHDKIVADRRARIVQLPRLVELSEMILQNRRLVALKNPVKRRVLRMLTLKSVGLAFEARLWRICFKHLRFMCERGHHDGPMALLARVLFAHADVQLLPRQKGDDAGDRAPWEKHTAFSPWGHRNTYAASFSDARSWVLRQLIRKPQSFALTLLSGHLCVAGSQHKLAIAEYCRAHRLAPFNALTCLCLSASYLSFSMSRTAAHRHDLILKGFSFMQRYKKLRLNVIGKSEAETKRKVEDTENPNQNEHRVKHRRLSKKTKDTSMIQNMAASPAQGSKEHQERILSAVARQAEASYNFGRGFQQLSLYHLAAKAYRDALAIFTALEHGEVTCLRSLCGDEISSPLPQPDCWRRQANLCAIRRSCAYNLALLYRGQGSIDMAQKALWDHVVF